MARHFAISALALALIPCWASAEAPSADCDPLVPQYCILPFPNDYYRTGSPPRLTGLNNKTFPITIEGKSLDPSRSGWQELDGFSKLAPIITYVDGLDDAQLNASGAARWWNIEASLSAASPILIVGPAEERIPHWVELDHSSDGGPLPGNRSHRALLIWPARMLDAGARYTVSIARSLLQLPNGTGAAAPVTPHMAALARGATNVTRGARSARAYRREVLEPLARAGVPAGAILQAWDFTVASETQFSSRMLAARDDSRSRMGPAGPKYKIHKVTDYNASGGALVGGGAGTVDNRYIARKIEGSMSVPFYLNDVVPQYTLRLVLDPATGLPKWQRDAEVKFEILVPHSVFNGTFGGASGRPARAVQYGHGLFGDFTEVEESYLGEDADRYGYVLGATTWVGLSKQDAVPVALMLSGVEGDIDDFAMVPDRCTQGMVNALALMQLMKGGLASDPALTFAGGIQPLRPVAGEALQTGYFGNSEGGISGHVYMALTQDVPRGLLGVSGGPYALLLPRSADFADLFPAIKARFEDPVERITLLSLMQLLWDRTEPSGYSNHISRSPLPGTPRHTVLMHYGLGDAQVSWLGAHLLGRSLEAGGASMFASNVREANETLFGFTLVDDATEIVNRSAIVGFEYLGVQQVPAVNKPPSKATDAHEKPRRDRRAQDMMDYFFRTGRVKNFCNGTCNGTASATDV